MIKQVTEVDSEFLAKLNSSIEEIKVGLRNIKAIPEKEYLTSDEFMSRIKVGRWKFEALIASGQLEYKKIGRKRYIPVDQVTKYFDGKLDISK